ncbi:MAG: formylglycine-generating enzyme family protein [Rectinemataceae bacterium]|jgi:formylglycine-generating enzyme required for sulfatase activity
MLKKTCVFMAVVLALSLVGCAGVDPAKIKEDPKYYYGHGQGRTKSEARDNAKDDLIKNAIIEAGGKFTRKEKGTEEGNQDKLEKHMEVTTEMIRTFELPALEPYYQNSKGLDFIVIYRIARTEWAKVQKEREERLRAELVSKYDNVIADPTQTIEERIVEAGRLIDRLATEGVADHLTRGSNDQTLLTSVAEKTARDLAGDILISATPAKGLVGDANPINVACTLRSTKKPAASIPLRYVWTAGDVKKSETFFADKDGKAQILFAAEPDFRDRSLGLSLSTNFSDRMPDSSLLKDFDKVSLISFKYRHVSNFSDFLSDYVNVPAGPFKAGAVARDRRAEASEAPRQVQLAAFAIGRNEVSNGLYKVYLDDKNVPQDSYPEYWDNPDYNKPDQPVIGISWTDANAFAEWLSEVSGQRLRLPSEDEWEKAARAGTDSIYPWGDESPKLGNRANFSGNNRFDRPAPVGSFSTGKNDYGLNDMAGNVAEWTSTQPDLSMKDDHSWRIVKGGSWTDGPNDLRVSRREARDPSKRYSDVGFRLVKEISNE